MMINTRLDEERQRKLEYLTRATRCGVSDVVKQAIDVYYEHLRQTQANPAAILIASGFVGCGEASPELSEQGQDELRRAARQGS